MALPHTIQLELRLADNRIIDVSSSNSQSNSVGLGTKSTRKENALSACT